MAKGCRGLIALLFGAALLAAGCAQTVVVSDREIVSAADVPELLRSKGCHACHAMDEALLGPSYRAIATMHAGGGQAITDALAEKIMYGGAGAWGVVPMPANDRVSFAQARAMAAWILDQGES